MPCENLVGVKNILFTFFDCETETTIGPISHDQATEDLPEVRTCTWTNEKLVGGFTKRSAADAMMTVTVIRDLRIPLSWYQGCAAISAQIEYENGLVYTGVNGGVVGDESSDTHEVTVEMTFPVLDELLPTGALAAA